jgi:pyridoxamine 5'-phosphate oxidase
MSIDVGDVDSDPLVQFAAWWAQAREGAVGEPDAMVLGTVDDEGWPSSRAVLLRGFDERGFVFFTNYTSAKARELDGAARASLTFHWFAPHRQVRVVGLAARVDEAESDVYFATRPRGSQLAAWASDQSTVIESRAALDERYAQVERRFAGGEVPRPPHWGGYRVQPLVVELWQAGDNRMHDRLRYTRDGAGWRLERLAP